MTTFVEEFVLRSWWVVVFILVCYAAFEQAMYRRNLEYDKLYTQFTSLQIEKENQLIKQKDLQLQISSQSDPAWIELTLMRRLGVVAEGQIKVYFTKAEAEHSATASLPEDFKAD